MEFWCAMPVEWTISHTYQLTIAVAKSQTSVEEVEEYLRGIDAEGGLRYRKLFIAEAGSNLTVDDVKRLGLVMHRYGRDTDLGPLAIVIGSEEQHATAAEYVQRAAAGRPLAAFRDEQEAREWLLRQPVGS
jgi:hypothetical protein